MLFLLNLTNQSFEKLEFTENMYGNLISWNCSIDFFLLNLSYLSLEVPIQFKKSRVTSPTIHFPKHCQEQNCYDKAHVIQKIYKYDCFQKKANQSLLEENTPSSYKNGSPLAFPVRHGHVPNLTPTLLWSF